ncbi:MAG: radical SAM protein [Acetatifactor sp.]|nr:radical SAM protein [Acetatifactor sp.]
MNENFDLGSYLTGGVEKIVKGAIKATLSNPQESIFLAKYAAASKIASKKRAEADARGEHIPPFLIASITSSCNLHCAGCYSRANHACNDQAPVSQLTDKEWGKIFAEAKDLGIGFILLAGGEPLLRKDVMEEAGHVQDILFPVFTNGTLISEAYIQTFEKYRNLVPVLSIEGRKEKTDNRRGEGVYDKAVKAMELMQDHKVIFGASVTVTTENLEEVTSEAFLEKLEERGCKVVFYVEFVPVTEEATHLAPGDKEREYLNERLSVLRSNRDGMVYVSFPGDEKTSGGCLAAGRGFFHINSHGGAEPCPFSPYSDINVRDTSVREALKSKLFTSLQDGGVLNEDHAGGCVLFERQDKVKEIMAAN